MSVPMEGALNLAGEHCCVKWAGVRQFLLLQDDDQPIGPTFNATDPVGLPENPDTASDHGNIQGREVQSMHGACGAYRMECLGKSGRLP